MQNKNLCYLAAPAVVVFLGLPLAACGDTTATPVPQTTSAAVTNVAAITITTTTAVVTTTAATTAPAKTSLGQELIGQSDEKGGLKATVTKVESFRDVTNTFTKQTYKPKNGLFLLIHFDLKNSGSAQALFSAIQLTDGAGRNLELAEFEAGFAFTTQIKAFTPNSQVEAGQTSQDFKAFDVPPDASGLKFKLV